MDVTYAAFSSHQDLENALDENGKVPIGRPVFNSVAYVLDEQMHPVPLGKVGQLYISSPNLCDGYVGSTTGNSQFISSQVGPQISFIWAGRAGGICTK